MKSLAWYSYIYVSLALELGRDLCKPFSSCMKELYLDNYYYIIMCMHMITFMVDQDIIFSCMKEHVSSNLYDRSTRPHDVVVHSLVSR